jgi:large subunit ribosomal protein L15
MALILHLPRPPYLLPLKLQSHQIRYASILTSLRDTSGSRHKAKRLGRGPASGKGKTSGRGHKGQKQHGKVPAGFNGGETRAEVSMGLPRGVPNPFREEFVGLNLDRLQSWVDQGRLNPYKPITVKELVESRCVNKPEDGVKLLARVSASPQ